MGLKKTIIDVPSTDGLAQKFDSRRLPVGKAAMAVNLQKNKQGRLEKRLGFHTLTTGSNTSFNPTAGLAVCSWNNQLTQLVRGTLAGSNITASILQTYSDDQSQWTSRGPVPELVVASDSIFANCPSASSSPYSIVSGDLIMIAWLAYSSSLGLTFDPGQLNIWYCVREISTGNFVQAPQIVASPAASVATGFAMRLILVGTTAVLIYTDASGFMQGRALAASAWTTTTFGSVANVQLSTQLGGIGDACSVTGDATKFITTRVATITGTPQFVVEKWALPLVQNSQTQTVVAALGALHLSAGFGVRASSQTNDIAVAYANVTGSGAYTISAAILVYSTMAAGAPIVIYTSNGFAQPEEPPAAIAVGFAGSLGAGPNSTWLIGWSPLGSRFNADTNATATNGGLSTPWLVGKDPNSSSFNNAQIKSIGVYKTGANVANIAGTLGSPYMTPGVHLVSQWLEKGTSSLYCIGWVPSQTQGTYYVMCADYSTLLRSTDANVTWTMRPVATLQLRTALSPLPAFVVYQNSGTTPTFDQSINTQSGLAPWALGADPYSTAYVTYLASTQGAKTMPALGAIQTAPRSGYQTAQYGTALAISGGLPTVFDGSNVFEQAFTYTPENLAWAKGAAGTGPTWTALNDTYHYICTYEFFDAQGNFHISGRSPPLAITGQAFQNAGGTLGGGGNNTKISINIPVMGLTMRAFTASANTANQGVPVPSGSIVIGIYRTQVNGSTFYRVADRFYNLADTSFPGVPNTFTSTVSTYLDAVSDAKLGDGTHPLLYGDGTTGQPGTQDNLSPPPSSLMVRHKERLFVANTSNLVYYTKARADLVGPGYEDLTQTFAVGGDDPIIGMESMDDKLVVLKRNQIFYVGGDGPDDSGGNNSFTPPQPIPTDVGCVDARSVRSTPEGVYFLSDAGLRLLTRGLSVEYVGGPVEDYLGSYPVMTAVSLYPNNNKIAFLVTAYDYQQSLGTPPSSVIIWRDYVLDAWTVSNLSYQVGEGNTSQPLVSSTVAFAPYVAGKERILHLMDYRGTVWRENDPLGANPPYFDYQAQNFTTPLYVPVTWQSPWIKPSDQGRFRVWDILSLMESADPHGLVLSVAFDYNPTFTRLDTWTWATGANPIAPTGNLTTPLTQLRTYCGQFVEAVKFQIQDASDVATVSGQGPKLLGLTVAMGVQEGPFKLPPGTTQ